MKASRASDSWRVLLCLLLAFGLAACGSPSSPPSRYSQKHDAAPPRVLDPDSIADAQPRPVQVGKAGNYSPYRVNGKKYHVMSVQDARAYKQRGTASWYGTKFHGHRTSNGEIYNMYGMSAAHKSLPIPCYVRVTNTDNGRSTIVRVNDRGPFHGERIIDLSYAAATKLGYVGHGVAKVQVEVIDPASYRPDPELIRAAIGVDISEASADLPKPYLQAAALSEKSSAESMRRQLLALLDVPVTISTTTASAATLYRVRIGPLQGIADVDHISNVLMRENFGRPNLIYE